MKRIAELAEWQGIDPRQLTVGDRINRLNPRTGQKEFQFQPPIPTLPPGGLNDDLPPGTYVDPSDPNHIFVVTPRNSNGDGGTVGTGQGNGGGQGPVNVSGSGGGFRLRTGGGNPSDFGPAPADWGSRNDPFGVFRGYNNQGTPMGRSFVKYQEDVGFIDRQNDYMRSIGINPDNITADDHERFYQAANTGVFDPFKPAYWVNRWQWYGATDPAVIGNRFMNDYYTTADKRGAKGGLTPEQTAMSQALLQLTLKNPKANLKDAASVDPVDLAMLQNIHVDDFYKGERLPDYYKDLLKRTGHLGPSDYVAPDGVVYRRTTNVRTNDNPASSLVSSVIRDKSFDPILELDDLSGPPGTGP